METKGMDDYYAEYVKQTRRKVTLINDHYDNLKNASDVALLDAVNKVIINELTVSKNLIDMIHSISELYYEQYNEYDDLWDGDNFGVLFSMCAQQLTISIVQHGGETSFPNYLDVMQDNANAMFAILRLLRERFEKNGLL